MEQNSYENIKESISNQTPTESEVINFIISCLRDKETYEYKRKLPNSNNLVFDLYLPEGCHALGVLPKTAIDVRRNIGRTDALAAIREKYDYTKDRINGMMVIYDKATDYARSKAEIYMQRERRNVSFVDMPELLSRYNLDEVKEIDNRKSLTDEEKQNANIEYAKQEIKRKKQIVLFLGAGVSKGAGVIGWDELLVELTRELFGEEEISFIKDVEMSPIQKGRYIIQEFDNQKKDYKKSVKSILYKNNPHACELINTIAKYAFCIDSIITYNYDDLVESTINEKYGKYCYSIYGDSRMPVDYELPVFHVHGYIPQLDNQLSSEIVLGEREYHQLYQQSYNWSNVEQLHALSRKTCFFIGLSMKDPNLRRLIDYAYKGRDELHHVVFYKRENEIIDRINYRIFEQMGVRCIWYDNHEDLPQLLDSLLPPEEVAITYRRKWDTHRKYPR